MTRTQVSFEARMYREARREAKRQGISFAEFCRRAVARSLPPPRRSRARTGLPPRYSPEEIAKKPWMRYAGIFDSGDPNASQTIDEVVYGRERP